MKKTKKNVLLALGAFCAIATCSAVVSINDVSAKADTATPTAAEFYMQEGAAVRTAKGELGIRFIATITEDYWTDLQETYGANATYAFYSEVTANGDTQKQSYGVTPTFTNKDTFDYYSTIVYKTAELGDLVDEAANLEFTAKTYVSITKVGETTATTLAADGETGARSMKAIANAAVLAGETNEELAKYFSVGNRSTKVTGYASVSGENSTLKMPQKSYAENDTATVYIGAQGYSATANAAGELVVSGLDMSLIKKADGTAYVGGDELVVSVFDDTTVYSTKIVIADTVIKAANVSDLLSVTGGYVVIGEDIDMSTAYSENNGVWTDVNTHNFVGTINGLNHKISKFKTSTGLIYNFNGTFKDLAFVDVETTINSGIISYGYQRTIGSVVIDNVYANVAKRGGDWAGLVGYVNSLSSTITFSNCIVIGDAKEVAYMGRTNGGISALRFNNCYAVNAVVVMQGNNPGRTETTDGMYRYADTTNFADAYLAGAITGLTDSILDLAAGKANITLINSSNIATLLTATSGTFMLSENIDMSKAYTDNGGIWTSTAVFTGTINGNGYTISNFKTTTGLFATLNGTAKNIAFVDAETSGEAHVGIIASGFSNSQATTIENVYASISCKSWSAGLFVGYINRNTKPISFINCVVVGKTENVGFIGKLNSMESTLTFTGSHAINAKACNGGNMTNLDASTLTIHNDIAAFQTAYDQGTVTTLSDFVLNKLGIETTSTVSTYSIVVPVGASSTEEQAAETLQSFFMKQQA